MPDRSRVPDLVFQPLCLDLLASRDGTVRFIWVTDLDCDQAKGEEGLSAGSGLGGCERGQNERRLAILVGLVAHHFNRRFSFVCLHASLGLCFVENAKRESRELLDAYEQIGRDTAGN